MIKAEWTNKDSLDLQQTCNKLATNLQPTEGDIISREGAIECIRWGESVTDVIDRIKALPSAEAVSGYTEWLEKIIVDNEGANEWLCEDTPDLEWCENNCHYSSIQAECLRHLYEVSKGGAE